jgi:DNA polymerase III sliding clamp (beta) subunit (PCNA family)
MIIVHGKELRNTLKLMAITSAPKSSLAILGHVALLPDYEKQQLVLHTTNMDEFLVRRMDADIGSPTEPFTIHLAQLQAALVGVQNMVQIESVAPNLAKVYVNGKSHRIEANEYKEYPVFQPKEPSELNPTHYPLNASRFWAALNLLLPFAATDMYGRLVLTTLNVKIFKDTTEITGADGHTGGMIAIPHDGWEATHAAEFNIPGAGVKALIKLLEQLDTETVPIAVNSEKLEIAWGRTIFQSRLFSDFRFPDLRRGIPDINGNGRTRFYIDSGVFLDVMGEIGAVCKVHNAQFKPSQKVNFVTYMHTENEQWVLRTKAFGENEPFLIEQKLDVLPQIANIGPIANMGKAVTAAFNVRFLQRCALIAAYGGALRVSFSKAFALRVDHEAAGITLIVMNMATRDNLEKVEAATSEAKKASENVELDHAATVV